MGGALLDLVFPRQCAGCGQPVAEEGRHLCWDCTAKLQFIQAPFCSRCGDPIDGAVDYDILCVHCTRREPSFTKARSAVRYRRAIRDALQRFKYGGATHLDGDLSVLLLSCIETHYTGVDFDAVAFVPLHPLKRRTRCYNQAQLLAARVARTLGLPLFPRVLVRVRDTGTQTHLTARERRDNMHDAFAARDEEWIAGRCFLLIDDVMTTGATVDECSRVLVEAGAAGVYVVTVARG